MEAAILLSFAYVVDLLVGDPRFLTHPVVLMGSVIQRLELMIRKFVSNEKALKWAGMLFPLILVGGSYATVWMLLKALAHLHPWLAWLAEVWLISTTIATKGLADAGLHIYGLLKAGNLAEGRRALSMVVGRDTDQLDEPEIVRGAVETVAENMVDAILSPLFYAAIGGAPLAMAYRAANTLDSMVGYKNERYRQLGWASARFDDLANYIPARICAMLLVMASWLMKLRWRQAWRMILRDARSHPSPNSGIPEAGVAGALGVQLGGLNFYQGVPSERARLGDAERALVTDDIAKTVSLMYLVSVLFTALCVVALALLSS